MLELRQLRDADLIATIGIGAIIENVILRLFGPQPQPQPLNLTGAVVIGAVHIPHQNLLILGVALGADVIVVGLALRHSRPRRHPRHPRSTARRRS